MISDNELPLNLILLQSCQVSAFMKPSSGSSYPRTKRALDNILYYIEDFTLVKKKTFPCDYVEPVLFLDTKTLKMAS
jgi:hypothetical protein